MRRVYLLRHGHPDFALGRHMCLGRTDTPLGPLGRMQAVLAGEALQGAELSAVFTSPLTRCRETAAPLGREAEVVDALGEQDMGVWDGLDFDEIKARWPGLYARRAAEPLLVPPGAETLADVQGRVLPALERCLERSTGDIAVVAHASVIQAILAAATGTPLEKSRALRPAYGCGAILRCDGALRPESGELYTRPPLTPALAEKLLLAAAPGEQAAAHCRAVAEECARIARALPTGLDEELLISAALLHDAARGEKDHAALCARWLVELGYPAAAALIEQHHDLKRAALDEASILYLADKCVQGDTRVGLERRFAASLERCTTPEARAAHAARQEAAERLRTQINGLCGQRIID